MTSGILPSVRIARRCLAAGLLSAVWTIAVSALGQSASTTEGEQPAILNADAGQLLTLANLARAAAGASPLEWDSSLAAAALKHCLRMPHGGPISHRYDGEPELAERDDLAGAHFSVIAENIGAAASSDEIQQGWMESQEHRDNLLNRDVDRVGIAVVGSGGFVYVVADYARSVPVLTRDQVEATFAGLLQARGLRILKDSRDARAYCAQSQEVAGAVLRSKPSYLLRWQNPDVTQLPELLLRRLNAVRYREAAVGSCPPKKLENSFTVYRVAVLLYAAGDSSQVRPFFSPNGW